MDQVDIWVMPSYSYHTSGTCTTHSPEALVGAALIVGVRARVAMVFLEWVVEVCLLCL